jgi:hypothetical protein
MIAGLRLDYQRNLFGRGWLPAGLLTIGFAMAVGIGWRYVEQRQQIASAEAVVSRLESGLRPRGTVIPVRGSPAEIGREMEMARAVISRLTLPWERMFSAIESVDDKSVALLMVKPDAERRRIEIGGEAKNLYAMLDYIGRLERSEPFSRVHLKSHALQDDNGQRAIAFLIEAGWTTP